jgi:hypothetical protein
MKKLLIISSFLALLVGCDERYRYPCQNPDNWNEAYCKKPFCSANGTCPEDMTHYLKQKNVTPANNASSLNSNKGDCK